MENSGPPDFKSALFRFMDILMQVHLPVLIDIDSWKAR